MFSTSPASPSELAALEQVFQTGGNTDDGTFLRRGWVPPMWTFDENSALGEGQKMEARVVGEKRRRAFPQEGEDDPKRLRLLRQGGAESEEEEHEDCLSRELSLELETIGFGQAENVERFLALAQRFDIRSRTALFYLYWDHENWETNMQLWAEEKEHFLAIGRQADEKVERELVETGGRGLPLPPAVVANIVFLSTLCHDLLQRLQKGSRREHQGSPENLLGCLARCQREGGSMRPLILSSYALAAAEELGRDANLVEHHGGKISIFDTNVHEWLDDDCAGFPRDFPLDQRASPMQAQLLLTDVASTLKTPTERIARELIAANRLALIPSQTSMDSLWMRPSSRWSWLYSRCVVANRERQPMVPAELLAELLELPRREQKEEEDAAGRREEVINNLRRLLDDVRVAHLGAVVRGTMFDLPSCAVARGILEMLDCLRSNQVQAEKEARVQTTFL